MTGWGMVPAKLTRINLTLHHFNTNFSAQNKLSMMRYEYQKFLKL